MPVNRNRVSGSDHPEKSRKRPRVPKFNEENRENEEEAQAPPQDDEEDDENLQEDIMEEGGHFVEDIYIPPKMSISERPTHGERLVIEKIECENFKSYGGIKVMGPFHKSFSAIIGPNGNGKSNIIDAMLFVFGYRAKKIRCKKVSVLIHKSELLPAVQSCAVTVHFLKIVDNGEDDDKLNIVPNSQIKVCRRAYRNNTSAYWLNSKRVQFTEVASFLKKSGIDIVHNRFLILQGEVEQIAQMPPKASNTHETGFLEFIDEIIGTKRYEKPLQQLKDRLEELDFQREEKAQRVSLAEQHKTSLVEPMKKATAYLKDRNTKIRTNHSLNQVKAFHSRKALEEKKEKLQELEVQRGTIQSRLDEIKKFNDEKRNEYAEAEKAYQIAEAKFKKNKKAMDDADAKYVQLNREMKSSNEERKKKNEEIKKVEAELEKLHGLPERHETEIGKLEKRKADLEEEVRKEDEATKGDIERVNKQIEQAVAEKKKADAELRKLKNAVDEKKIAFDTLKKELSRGQEAETTEKAKLVKMQSELEELQNVVKRKSGRGLDVSTEDITRKEAQAQKMKREAFELTNMESEKRNAFMQLRNQYAEALDTAEGGRTTNKVDQALFQAKRNGNFAGLYGRLKDLANIEEKYNIAATVATGMLDYWVVDNDSTGAECIQFLKEKRLPTQTFVCVSKMGRNVQEVRVPFRAPANSKRIFDLLKIRHAELAPVFYKAFTNTLVAENLDIATEVSYSGRPNRHRVVTCQGDVVEATGSLVGGGTRPTSGKFNSEMSKTLGKALSKQQLDALKQRLDAAEKEFMDVSNRKKELENEAFTIEKDIAEAKAKMANYHSDLEASRKMIPMKEQLIRQQEEKVKQTTIAEKTLKEKKKRIEEAEAAFESAKEPYEEAEDQVKVLTEKINSLNEDKKKEILKKLNKLKEQLKRVKEEINKLNIELKNFEKNKTKAETKRTKLKDEVEMLQNKMLAMNEEKKSLEATALKLKEEEEVLKTDKEEKEQVYNELKSKANEFDKEEKKLNKDKVVVENNLQALSDEVRNREREERSLVASLSTFELSEIPETEVEPLEMFSEEQLAEMNIKELESKLAKYTNRLKREEPNLNIIEDYNKACETLLNRIAELDAVNARRDTFNTEYLTLEAQRMKEFMEGFSQISTKVKELFRMISMGGDAELDLVDTTDPFTCGIDFSVRPRGKTWKKIINLSGGEKTLSSLALVFSLHHFKPSPFYVMDEIDAALDFQNVSIIANYIKDRTKFTQFIIISLRSNMFELADSLLGVYKVDNMSYSIRIGVNNVVNKLKSAHANENRPYQMGYDDNNSAASRSKQTTGATITSSQATTVPVSSQQSQASTVPPTGVGNRKPSLDLSAIQDPNATAETEKLSQASNRPTGIVKESNGKSSKDSGHPSTTDNSNKNGVEEMDTSQDLFENSFEQEKVTGRGPVPIASSTPCTSTGRGRTSLRQGQVGLGDLSEVREEEEAEAGTGSDDSNASALSDALSSLNNSSVNNSQS